MKRHREEQKDAETPNKMAKTNEHLLALIPRPIWMEIFKMVEFKDFRSLWNTNTRMRGRCIEYLKSGAEVANTLDLASNNTLVAYLNMMVISGRDLSFNKNHIFKMVTELHLPEILEKVMERPEVKVTEEEVIHALRKIEGAKALAECKLVPFTQNVFEVLFNVSESVWKDWKWEVIGAVILAERNVDLSIHGGALWNKVEVFLKINTEIVRKLIKNPSMVPYVKTWSVLDRIRKHGDAEIAQELEETLRAIDEPVLE